MAERAHTRYVLDSYAVIAFFEGQAGGERVESLLQQAEKGNCTLYMSVVNLGEILYTVERERGIPVAQWTLARLDELPIVIVEADRALTLAAAHIKARYPVAYADVFAAALARILCAPLLTGDPEFRAAGMDAIVPIINLN
jgi:ribonuclease VapC